MEIVTAVQRVAVNVTLGSADELRTLGGLMKFELKTTPLPNGVIEQELLSKCNNPIHNFTKWVVDTREQSIKEALISLGWVPPNTQMQTDKKPDCPDCELWFGERKNFCPGCGKAFYFTRTLTL